MYLICVYKLGLFIFSFLSCSFWTYLKHHRYHSIYTNGKEKKASYVVTSPACNSCPFILSVWQILSCCWLFYFLKQGFTMKPCLIWNILHQTGRPWTHRDLPASVSHSLLPVFWIKGMSHHTVLLGQCDSVFSFSSEENLCKIWVSLPHSWLRYLQMKILFPV